mmetsp:Transcript_6719/g.16714  ORF Transcript_6719/g.16714 Transcript_6719/m.16714 type:complete len:202 (+) Transcript_6719:776-1381(+)
MAACAALTAASVTAGTSSGFSTGPLCTSRLPDAGRLGAEPGPGERLPRALPVSLPRPAPPAAARLLPLLAPAPSRLRPSPATALAMCLGMNMGAVRLGFARASSAPASAAWPPVGGGSLVAIMGARTVMCAAAAASTAASDSTCISAAASGNSTRLNVALMRSPYLDAGARLGTQCCHACCVAPFMTSRSPLPRVKASLRS